MALIVIADEGDGSYRTNLTDKESVWGRKRHAGPVAALREVARLIYLGHRPAFASAYRDLAAAVEGSFGARERAA